MRNIVFTPEQIETFRIGRFEHPNLKIRIKFEVLWLKSQGLHHTQIAKLAGVSRRSVQRYLDEFLEGGIERLCENRCYRPQSQLEDYRDLLEDYFLQNPPATVAQAQAAIEELTGLKRSATQVRLFLKKVLGLGWRKVGSIPQKADPEEQKEFYQHKLKPRLTEAQKGRRQVWFVDASHFVHGAYLGYVWCLVRLFVPFVGGRRRYSVLGALNAVTLQLLSVQTTGTINTASVCELLHIIAKQSSGKITVVLDNARYQKNDKVAKLARELGIHLLYLPAYSPNLNLIERVWKFLKQKCLYSRYYPDFTKFCNAIQKGVEQCGSTYKEELKSLLTLNFQFFEDVPTVAA